MKTAEFNKNYEIDRKSKGLKAMPKHSALSPVPEIQTADGTVYKPNQTYFYFDSQSLEVRQSLGLRRNGEFLCMFGLKVIAVAKLRACKDDALSDGQSYFNAEIERLRNLVRKYETDKSLSARSLNTVLMSR